MCAILRENTECEDKASRRLTASLPRPEILAKVNVCALTALNRSSLLTVELK